MFFAVQSKVTARFNPGIPQTKEPGGDDKSITSETHADVASEKDDYQVKNLQEHVEQESTTDDSAGSMPAILEISGDLANFVVEKKTAAPQNNQVNLDLIDHETWRISHYDTTTNLKMWTVSLYGTQKVHSIFFIKKQSNSLAKTPSEFSVMVGSSSESEENTICVQGKAENSLWICGFSGRFLNLIAADTFFDNYNIVAFSNDVFELDIKVDYERSVTLITLPDFMMIKGVELFSSPQNPPRLLIRSFYQNIEACNIMEGLKHENGLSFQGNQILINTDQPFLTQAIMTVVSCDCFLSLSQRDIVFKDAYVGGQEQTISLANDGTKGQGTCLQRKIKLMDKLTGVQIFELPYNGLSWDQSTSEVRLRPMHNMNVGSHTVTLNIQLDNLNQVSYDVSITFKVKLAEKLEDLKIRRLLATIVGVSDNCLTSAGYVSLLYRNTVVASQSDFDPSGAQNSNTGCDGVTLWDYSATNSVVTTSQGPVNFWRAAFTTPVTVETVMFINNDNNRSQYKFSMGDNPSVNLNPTCATVNDGGWVTCQGQGMYFGIWSDTLPVMFIEIQMYKQEAIQVYGGYSAAFSYLDSGGVAQPLIDTNYPADRALAAPLILYENTSPARGNLCEISKSMTNFYAMFTMVLRAQVEIDSVVILCGDSKAVDSSGVIAPTWTTKCNNPTRISVQDVVGTKTACGTDISNYQTYSEAPCNKQGNTIIAERTVSGQKMFLCGFGVLSSCDCTLTTFDQTKMPLNIQNLVSETTITAVVGGVIPTPITVNSMMQDTVSRVCGNGDGVTKCGQRHITVKRSTGESINSTPWKGITFNQATGKIDLNPKSAGDIGVFTLNVSLTLKEYPLVPVVVKSITITVTGGPYYCKIAPGSMNLLNTAVIASQSSYKYRFNTMPFEACDGVILDEVDLTTSIAKKHAVSTEDPITSNFNVWTAQFSTTQSLKSALLINTEDQNLSRMSNFKLRIGMSADITLNTICNQTLTDGGWYECVGSGTYFSIHSETTPVYLVEVMLYSLYFIQMNAHSATITAEDIENYVVSNSITSTVIVRLLRQPNSCVSSKLANDPVFLMTLNSQTKIKAIVLIPGNQDLCSSCIDWASNQKQVQVAVIDVAQQTTLCGDPLSNYNTYSEALCNNAPGNQIQVKRPGQGIILSFCGVAVLTECNCAYSTFDPIYSPLSTQKLSQTSSINYNVGESAEIILLESLMQDSVSRTCGNGDGLTFCGARTITVKTVSGSTPITSSPAVTGLTFQNNQITVFSNKDSDVSTFAVRVQITLNSNLLVFYYQDITVIISGRLPSYCTIPTDLMNLLNTSVLVTQSAFQSIYNSNPNVGCNSKMDYTLTQDKLENTVSPLVLPATTTYWIAKFIQSTLVQTALIINVDGPSQSLLKNDFLYVGDNPVPSTSVATKCSGIPLDGGWWSCGLTGMYFAIVSTINQVVFVEVMLYSLHAIQMNASSVAMITAAQQTGYIMPTIPISNIVVLDTSGTQRSSTCIAAMVTPLESSYQVTLKSEVFISGVVMLPVIYSAVTTDNTSVAFFVTDVSGVNKDCGHIADYTTYKESRCNSNGNVVNISRQGPSQYWNFCSFGILSPCSCLESSFDPTKMPLWTDTFVQLASMSVQIDGVSQTNTINFSQHQDTVSTACGTADGLVFCGQREIEIFHGALDLSQQPQPYKGVLSWANPTLTLSANSIDQVTQFTITVKVSLKDYPLVSRSINIPITVNRVQTACGEQDVASSNLLTSQTMASQSGFIPNYNTDSGKGCDTQIITETISFVAAKTSSKDSFWMADLISDKLIQTALIVIDEQFSNRISLSKLRVGASIWPSENKICNEQMTAGGWWPCGLTGRYFSIDSTTVEVAFSEILLFSFYTVQQNARPLSSNQDLNFSVANSILMTVMISSTGANNCQKTIETTDPNFQYTLNAPIVVRTLVLVPSVDQMWASFQKDVTLCVKNTFAKTESCKTSEDYSQKYLQVQMNFEGNVIQAKKTGLSTLGFCSFSALSQCDCAATSFDLAKMPQFVIMANTLVSSMSLNSTIGDSEKTITILNQNTVSQVCGKADGTFCGPSVLTFTDKTSGSEISKWPYRGLTWDEVASLIRFKPLSNVDVGAFTLKVTTSLQNYPAASQSTEISVLVNANEVLDPCSSTKITTTSDLEIKVTLIYYKDTAEQMMVPAVSDSYSTLSGKVQACGPFEYASSKEVDKIITFDSSKQIVTLFVTKKNEVTFGTYDLSVSVGLKNYKKVTPLTFKYTYTLNKCLVSSIVPDFAAIETVISIGGSPVSVVMPNWIMTPDCGYLPLSYTVTGDTSLVTQSPTWAQKTIKLSCNDTTIGQSSTKTIIVSPVYSSLVGSLIPKQFASFQINVAFSLNQDIIEVLQSLSNKTSFVPTTFTPANQMEQGGKVKELPTSTVKFGKLNSKGLMTIHFSRAIVMLTYDIKEMTSLLFDTSKGLSFESSSQRNLKASIKRDRRVANLELSIEYDEEVKNHTAYSFFVSNITANNITVQTLFENPILISSGRAPDKLIIKVNSFSMFKTSDGKDVRIKETQAIQTQSLPSMQVNTTAFVGAMAQTTSDSTQIMFIVLTVAKIFADYGMHGLDDHMKQLGLVLHLMCAGLMYPQVMQAFFNPVLSFLTLDIVPISGWLQEGFNWTITPYTPNFDAMGYSSGQILYNLGSLSVILVLTPIFALILRPLHKSQCLHVKIRTWATKKFEELVWNGLIETIDSNYLILLLCVMVNIKTFDGDWGKDMLLNNIFCILSFFVVASFPIVLFSLTWHYYDDIMDEESDLCKKFGGHMESYHKKRNSKRVVMASRFMQYPKVITLCLAFVFLTEDPWAVISINNFTTLYEIMFVVYYYPHEDPKANLFHAKANIVFMFFNYHMLCLTAFVPDPEMRYYIGCSACCLVTLDILIAVVSWAKETYPKIVKFFRKKCIYEPKLKQINDAKYKELMAKIKKKNLVADEETPNRNRRANQVNQDGNNSSAIHQVTTRKQTKRREMLEKIVENDQENIVSSESVAVSLRAGQSYSERMDQRMVSVIKQISLIKLEVGMEWVDDLVQQNLNDLTYLLPDDFETRSPRSSQILVQDLIHVFQNQQVGVQPISQLKISKEEINKTDRAAIKHGGHIGDLIQEATCNIGSQVIDYEVEGDHEQKRPQENFSSYQNVFESSSKLVKDYKEKEEAKEREVLKSIFRKGRTEEEKMRAKNHFI